MSVHKYDILALACGVISSMCGVTIALIEHNWLALFYATIFGIASYLIFAVSRTAERTQRGWREALDGWERAIVASKEKES